MKKFTQILVNDSNVTLINFRRGEYAGLIVYPDGTTAKITDMTKNGTDDNPEFIEFIKSFYYTTDEFNYSLIADQYFEFRDRVYPE